MRRRAAVHVSSKNAIITTGNIQCTDEGALSILSIGFYSVEVRGSSPVAVWGALTIACVLAAILFRKLSPLAALVLIPVLTSVASGFGSRTSSFIISGIQSMASVISMFVFAILFFGVLTDAGMLHPLIHWMLRIVGKSPVRIVPGTFLFALLIHLDGSGAVVFLITMPALLPLYDEVGIDRRILA